jgi:uncharacterized protein YqgQ
MKYIFIFLLFLLIGINYVLIKKESFQVIDPRLEQIRLNKIEIKRIKSNVCTKNNIPLDRCKCNIAIVTHIFDKKVTQPLNKYSDIFNFSKNSDMIELMDTIGEKVKNITSNSFKDDILKGYNTFIDMYQLVYTMYSCNNKIITDKMKLDSITIDTLSLPELYFPNTKVFISQLKKEIESSINIYKNKILLKQLLQKCLSDDFNILNDESLFSKITEYST